VSNEEDLEPGEYGEPGPADLPHRKSRLIGGLLVFLGVLMAIVVFSGELDKEGGKMKALVALLASGGLWVGIGLLLFPWTNRMVKGFTAENNAMIGFHKLPVLWKAWLVSALVLSVGAVVAVIVTGK
jgi:hypothetical protein